MNKLDELELKLEGSKWFLPFSFLTAFVVLFAIIGAVYVFSTMEENFEQNRPQYDFINERYDLTSTR